MLSRDTTGAVKEQGAIAVAETELLTLHPTTSTPRFANAMWMMQEESDARVISRTCDAILEGRSGGQGISAAALSGEQPVG